MTKCFYCDAEAHIEESYNGIPILVCSEGHRTGVVND